MKNLETDVWQIQIIEHVHDYQQMENGRIVHLNKHGMEVHGHQRVKQQVQVHIINEHQ
jgi:hypothetical protein